MRINDGGMPNQSSTSTARDGHIQTTSHDPFRDVLKETISSKIKIDQHTLTTERLRERNAMLEAARTDSRVAEKLAYGYAHNSLSSPLLDLSDRPNVRYTATGELVTSKTQQYFRTISQAMQIRCSQIYQLEKSKRTPPAEILEKIFNFHDSMPKPFKDMLGF